MFRKDFQPIARTRIREARVLLRVGEYAGAYHLAGQAIECALKACIARQTQRYEFPDKTRANNAYEHDPSKLAKLGGSRST
jgi:HEPN domain-containing protein